MYGGDSGDGGDVHEEDADDELTFCSREFFGIFYSAAKQSGGKKRKEIGKKMVPDEIGMAFPSFQ